MWSTSRRRIVSPSQLLQPTLSRSANAAVAASIVLVLRSWFLFRNWEGRDKTFLSVLKTLFEVQSQRKVRMSSLVYFSFIPSLCLQTVTSIQNESTGSPTMSIINWYHFYTATVYSDALTFCEVTWPRDNALSRSLHCFTEPRPLKMGFINQPQLCKILVSCQNWSFVSEGEWFKSSVRWTQKLGLLLLKSSSRHSWTWTLERKRRRKVDQA